MKSSGCSGRYRSSSERCLASVQACIRPENRTFVMDPRLRSALSKAFLSIKKIEDPFVRLKVFIAYSCGACIGGIKPAVLVRLPMINLQLGKTWEVGGMQICKEFGIKSLELCSNSNGPLVLLYSPRHLSRCLRKRTVSLFLASRGYPSLKDSSYEDMLVMLVRRFCIHKQKGCYDSFPHEIGVFLGYPLTDVISYLESRGGSCPCTGYWKAWHKPEKACRSFRYLDYTRLKVFSSVYRKTVLCLSKEC